MVCMSWHDLQDGSEGVVPHVQGVEMLTDWLESGRHFYGLNLAYDWGVLAAEAPHLLTAIFKALRKGRVRDLGLDQRLIDIAKGRFKYLSAKGYSLAVIARRYGIELEKEDTPRLTYGRLRGQPIEAYSQAEIDYALLDAQVPAALYTEHLKEQEKWARTNGDAKPLLSNGPERARADFALHLASCWGVHTNAGRCRELEQELDETIDRAAAMLKDVGLVRANGTKDTKAAKALMVDVCKARNLPVKLTDKGQVALDQEACEDTGDDILAAYTTFARAGTLRTRVQDLSKGSGAYPLQPRYGVLQDTGRTSSSKPRDPLAGTQIQNMPKLKGSRETLEPRPGMIFFGADFDAAEMHTLAQTLIDWFGTSTLANTLNAGLCPHVSFGAALRGMTYEEADKHADKKAIRTSAKPGNFGIPGGMGARTFQIYARGYGVNLTLEEAQRHIQVFKQADPEIAEYLRIIGNHINQGQDTVCLPRSHRWRGGLTYSSMANGFFQSPCADGALSALCAVQERCYTVRSSALYGCRVWGFIHDEILGEAPIDQAPEAAEELSEVMQEHFNAYTPDVPTGAEPAIFWRWSKGTDPVRDVDGRLVPSDPTNKPEG